MNFLDLSRQDQQDKLVQLMRELFESSGYTQRALAPKVCMDKSSVGLYLVGERQFKLLDWLKWCEVLEIEPAEFLKRLQAM